MRISDWSSDVCSSDLPDRGDRRYDVRLIAAVGNHIMGPLLGAEMLAAHVPADVHQLHPVKRGAAPPGCASGMGAVALECILDRDEAGARRLAPEIGRAHV